MIKFKRKHRLRMFWLWMRSTFTAPINVILLSLVSIYTALWGLWVANPFWDIYGKSRVWTGLQHLAPEGTWGGLAIAVGLYMLLGAIRSKQSSIMSSALAGAAFWTIVSVSFFAGDYQSTAGLTSAFAVFINLYIYLTYRYLPPTALEQQGVEADLDE